ncbi:MAG TPA: GntR family transcriptional regulator [Pseudonocardiaceae bacterium]|nr:GntR family transcriptional regulator [Pseudonocardiaceae bacterium]
MDPQPATWVTAPLGRVAAPLRDQVLNVVRQAILDFKLRPGQRLIERELVEQLGVSRATVREVLALLVSEGLVTVIPQKGAIVSVLSATEAADIYEMRQSLEALVVRRFIERATPENVRDLRASLVALEQVSATDTDRLAELRAKDAFYNVLFVGANSQPLAQILTTLQGRVQVLRATSLSVPGRAAQAAQELRRVVELIEAGDAEGAANACAEHVRNAAKAGLIKLAEFEPVTTGKRKTSAPQP